jgi:Na+-transporting NADH:ubiquinone oxidoreductase subunit C
MSNAGTFKRRIFPILFMLIITLVFISVTTVIYTFSKDTIKFNEALRLRRAVLYASGVPLPEQPQEIEQLYSERVEEVTEGGNVKYYLVHGDDPSTVASYVVVTRGPGLWGEITVAIGYDESGKQVSGLEVIDQNETPGLGGRIGEEWFKSQFRGKQYPLSMVSEGAPAGNTEFQAITGASYSSAAIRDIVNSTSDALLSSIR